MANYGTALTGDAIYYYDDRKKKSEGWWEHSGETGIWKDYINKRELIKQIR